MPMLAAISTRRLGRISCKSLEPLLRTFVRLRELHSSHADLARKLTALEHKYDSQFKAVFDAIRALMAAPAATKRKIGFRSE
jgi:hypothetical protein